MPAPVFILSILWLMSFIKNLIHCLLSSIYHSVFKYSMQFYLLCYDLYHIKVKFRQNVLISNQLLTTTRRRSSQFFMIIVEAETKNRRSSQVQLLLAGDMLLWWYVSSLKKRVAHGQLSRTVKRLSLNDQSKLSAIEKKKSCWWRRMIKAWFFSAN